MECRSVDKLMDAYLDRELEPASAAEVGAHLAACDRCRREWGGLVTLLTDPLPVNEPLGLRDRIVARVMEEYPGPPARLSTSTARPIRWMRWYRYAGAVAACMAFFVTGWLVSGWWKGPHILPTDGGTTRPPSAQVVASPWMMSTLAQAAAMTGPISPAVLLAQGVVPELMVTPAAMSEPTIRVRPQSMGKAATQPAEPLTAPEFHVLPMAPRVLGA
jgi:anti-sigma factor RsiW